MSGDFIVVSLYCEMGLEEDGGHLIGGRSHQQQWKSIGFYKFLCSSWYCEDTLEVINLLSKKYRLLGQSLPSFNQDQTYDLIGHTIKIMVCFFILWDIYFTAFLATSESFLYAIIFVKVLICEHDFARKLLPLSWRSSWWISCSITWVVEVGQC